MEGEECVMMRFSVDMDDEVAAFSSDGGERWVRRREGVKTTERPREN